MKTKKRIPLQKTIWCKIRVGFRNHSRTRGDCRRHTGTDGGT